jgi:long-chain fatty acid transport protein
MAFTGASGGAFASAFQLLEQNASGLGNAYAGQAAAAENASTVFYNPAGMTRLPGTQAAGTLSYIKPSIEFANSGTSASPIPPFVPLGDNGGNAGSWVPLPAAQLSWQVNPNWWVGIGLGAPFGLKTSYDAGFIGRFQSQTAELKTYDINPSVAWKVNDVVSLGAGISFQRADFTLDRATIVGLPVVGATHLDVSDDSWGWNIGALFNIDPATRLGFSYRSSIDHELTGDINVSGVPVVGTRQAPIEADIRFPDTYSVAVAHAFNDRWEGLADFTYTRWSTVKSVPITTTAATPTFPVAGTVLDTFNFQFDDSWRVGVGVNYRWSDCFMLKFGVAYDQSPVSDQFRLVALPDASRTWLAIGSKYALSKQTTLDVGYAHLFVKDASINQTKALQGTVAGNYENSVDILSAQLSFQF